MQKISEIKVSDKIRQDLSRKLTLGALGIAIKDISNNKISEKGTLTEDFYKVIWNNLSRAFNDMVNELLK